MNGMQMLLEQLGIDPKFLTTAIAEVQAQFKLTSEQLARIESKLDQALAANQGESNVHSGSESNGAGADRNGAGGS